MRKALLLLLFLFTACSSSPKKIDNQTTETPSALVSAAPRLTSTPTPLPTLVSTSTSVPTATLTPTPPVGVLPTVKAEGGWVRYRNDIAGFEISIPQGGSAGDPEARIMGQPLSGAAEGYKPPDMSLEDYERITHQAYGDRLCTWIFYQRASIVIQSRKAGQEMGQNCFDWNTANAKAVEKTETVTVDGADTQAWGFLLSDKSGQPYLSLMMISLPDGGAIAYSSETADADEYQDYLDAHTHDMLLEIIKTYHAFPVESTPAVPVEKK